MIGPDSLSCWVGGLQGGCSVSFGREDPKGGQMVSQLLIWHFSNLLFATPSTRKSPKIVVGEKATTTALCMIFLTRKMC